jgi:hypothetical protein
MIHRNFNAPILLSRGLTVFATAAALSFGGFVAAQEEAAAPERIDLANFPGKIVDQVVVPIPAEIFSVLDKLDEPEWSRGVSIPDEPGDGSDRSLLALTFGSLVGEGFIAVQAEDADDIEKIGKEVLDLSQALGLSNAVQPHSLAIIEAAGDRDWERVRDELDSTQQTVRDTMDRLRDQQLSELVSLGGWLRGTNVVTTFIRESFREDKAELLNQPGLIIHFREILGKMEGPFASTPQIRAISTGLARMEAIITGDGVISEEDIRELNEISRAMLEEYYFTS